MPWELIADDAGSLAQRLSVRRQLEEPKGSKPHPAQLPLRILYIVSRPSDAGFLDPRFTAKALLDALEPLGADVKVEFCRPPTLEQMEEMLCIRQEAGAPFDIVHFDGHGNFSKEKQVGVLSFEEPADAFGRAATDPVSATALGALLSRHAIPLVILEACRTATVGPTPVIASVASHLIDAGVGSVLAMSHAVHVEATRLLMNCFYRELVRGATLDEAVSAARKALRDHPSRWLKAGPDGRTIELQDWFLPHLYHSDEEDRLVPSSAHPGAEGAARASFRPPAAGEEVGSFPPPPQFGFQGRAWELHKLERRLEATRGLVLHAMGGMGKTALATEAAHWWTRSGLFRDGACFLSFEQFMSADRAVQVLGTYLAGPKFEQLPAVEQRRRAIELFQKKSVLLVWDNFESVLPQFNDGGAAGPASFYTTEERHRLIELFRDLTKGNGNGCLLVTCRPGDTGLPRAQRYELEGLARADSLWLLASILEREGLTVDDAELSRENLDPLLRDLDDHPLSLELVGPYLRTMKPEEIRADFGKLLAEFQQAAPEERNQSLLASLEFSRRHLSLAAREALPWLGLFRSGVFEDHLHDVSQLAPEAWDLIRRELERIALLRTEYGFGIGDRPFLRFHPTLAFAVADPTLSQNPEIRHRFLRIYFVLRKSLHTVLQGTQPRAALEVLSREEANYRIAVQWALTDQQFPAAAVLGETFRIYLERSGRLRERDAWVRLVKDAVGREGLTGEAASYEMLHAWTIAQSDPQGAVDQLQALIERLRHTTGFDPAFQLAAAITTLGRVLVDTGASAQAIPILREAVGHWEMVAEKEGGQPWEVLSASPDRAETATELSNLAATTGDLATALRSAGQYDEALAVAERSLEILTKLGSRREIAAAEERYANILRDAGRYDEADSRYDRALTAARQTGAKDVESTIHQGQGNLAAKRNRFECSSRLYQQALKLFQEAGNEAEIMRIYNFLGIVEQKASRLAEARSWFEKSRGLAERLKNLPGLGQTAQNIGIVWQLEGEAARERGDELTALRYVKESLRIWRSQKNKPNEAKSRRQLAQIHFRLGNLAAAERHALRAVEIHESLGLKEVFMDYDTLSEIAHASGNSAAAAKWAKQRDDLVIAEFERSAREGALHPQILQAFQGLTLACAGADFGDGGLGPREKEALVQLEGYPAPFPAFATFLRQIAAGQVPPIPTALPVELREWLEELVRTARPRANEGKSRSRRGGSLIYEGERE